MNDLQPRTNRGSKELALLIQSCQEVLVARLTEGWAACLRAPAAEVEPLAGAMLAQLVAALDTGAAGRLVDPFAEWAREQAKQGLEAGGLLRLTHSLSRSLWDVVEEAGGTVVWLRELADLVALAQTTAIDALMAAHDARQRRALSREQERTVHLTGVQDQLTQQLRELSTPVIQVWEEVLVLPLVGTLDSDRASRVMEDLLQGIVSHQAEIVIIDVTGVPVVDADVVHYLMQTIQAAGLLGARSVLVGIGAEVARAMVHLGIDLRGVETRGNLQAGIEFALQALQLQIVPQDQVGAAPQSANFYEVE